MFSDEVVDGDFLSDIANNRNRGEQLTMFLRTSYLKTDRSYALCFNQSQKTSVKEAIMKIEVNERKRATK